MSLLTPTIQHELNAETDARFWAQTGYQSGQKLDPKNPYDQAMIPVWQAVYSHVLAEWQGGRLVLTKDHPAVQQAIAVAADHTAAAVGHTHNAAAAIMPDAKAEHAAQAQAAQASSIAASKSAAAMQPASTPLGLLAEAAHRISGFVSEAGSVSPADAVSAMAVAHAPDVAAAAGAQAPEKKSTAKTLAIVGGCFAAILLAGFLNMRDDGQTTRRVR